MSIISKASPIHPVDKSPAFVDKNIEKYQKGINTALALKTTAIVLAVLMTALTVTAAFLVFPAVVIIGASLVAGVLLTCAIAALIAQEVLLKKKRVAVEKVFGDKNILQEQLIQDLKKKQGKLAVINNEFSKKMPGIHDVLERMDKYSKSLEKNTNTSPEAVGKNEIHLTKDEEAKIATDFIEEDINKAS